MRRRSERFGSISKAGPIRARRLLYSVVARVDDVVNQPPRNRFGKVGAAIIRTYVR